MQSASAIKLRLFLPIAIIIVIIIVFITTWFINKSIVNFNTQFEKTLELEVLTIVRMFERENILKIDKVQSNLKVVESVFNEQKLEFGQDRIELSVENQFTGSKHNAFIRNWLLNDESLFDNNGFVDRMQQLVGGTITIFQRIDSGFVRMSTNVKKIDGSRAVGTFMPNKSPVAAQVNTGNSFIGRALILDKWYVTAYKPIYHKDTLQGMLYVGFEEKDIDELKGLIESLKIGKSGYPFVFDKEGNMIIHPFMEDEKYVDSVFWSKIADSKEGVVNYVYNNKNKTMAFKYFEPFELYIAATVENDVENAAFIKDAVKGAVIVSFIAVVLLLALIYYFTSKRLYKMFLKLEVSYKKIKSISEALVESEERFQKLFDSTGDDIFVTDENENIVEINDAACSTLGYTREELLAMKITEIKTEKFKSGVSLNRKIIYEKGKHTFESEHLTKEGLVVPVEFISRVVKYKNQKLILSVVRDMTQRKEIERKILSTVIRTEERERERFARDMHDGLGPLLSTIKLYVSELKSSNLPQEEREDLVKSSNELIDEAVNSTRTISNNLMPRIINTYGLVKALDEFCNKVNKAGKLHISFDSEGLPERLHHDIELIIFRVVSELINNTIKHANAQKVLILLIKRGNAISLFFKDDGIGFNVEDIMNNEHLGMGLKNIISRIKSINGVYVFNSVPGKGFSINIDINV